MYLFMQYMDKTHNETTNSNIFINNAQYCAIYFMHFHNISIKLYVHFQNENSGNPSFSEGPSFKNINDLRERSSRAVG